MLHHPTTLTIVTGQTASNVVDLSDFGYGRSVASVIVFVPASVAEGLVLQVSPDNSNWFTYQSGAIDVALPAGKATTVMHVQAPFMRVLADGAVAATRTITVRIGIN